MRGAAIDRQQTRIELAARSEPVQTGATEYDGLEQRTHTTATPRTAKNILAKCVGAKEKAMESVEDEA